MSLEPPNSLIEYKRKHGFTLEQYLEMDHLPLASAAHRLNNCLTDQIEENIRLERRIVEQNRKIWELQASLPTTGVLH